MIEELKPRELSSTVRALYWCVAPGQFAGLHLRGPCSIEDLVYRCTAFGGRPDCTVHKTTKALVRPHTILMFNMHKSSAIDCVRIARHSLTGIETSVDMLHADPKHTLQA